MTNGINNSIQETIKKMSAAWNKHDAKNFSMLFAEEADLTNPLGQSFRGREAIEKQHAYIFSNRFSQSRLVPQLKQVLLLNDYLASVAITWQMTGSYDLKGNPWPQRRGLINLIVRKEQDQWPILIMHSMDISVPFGKMSAGEKLLRFFSHSFPSLTLQHDTGLTQDEEDQISLKLIDWISRAH
jgi:uncharacterized protein (TIGR02246 family)